MRQQKDTSCNETGRFVPFHTISNGAAKVSDLQETNGGRILGADEPHPLETFNKNTQSDYFIICEHAGRRIPASLGTMGLSEEDRKRHIAWDIGARSVAVALSQALEAPLYMQRYSRLICDCNRHPDVLDFAPEISEATPIPGNQDLSQADRKARADAIFWPFHDAVAEALALREKNGLTTKVVTIHSFTPSYLGKSRPWEIGILYNRDLALAPAIAEWLKAETDLYVGVNQPYAVSDDSDYSIPVHGEKRGLPCVEFEIRNDLISSDEEAEKWAALIRQALFAVEATGSV
ncbi:N-formylglutamate amidohydrolase [Chelativorans sp. YIM 93263]|uniref:N-formylglutamate amidohydrolase n=1 Tax=Chelativorans sp. YIM 93263 TaxID=2906648 RepID=UPI0023783B27|nr:N-formylglutamate amidohydrolase [Chelativorans sp. YIM 93263]